MNFIAVRYRDMCLCDCYSLLILSSVLSVKCDVHYEPAEHLYVIFLSLITPEIFYTLACSVRLLGS